MELFFLEEEFLISYQECEENVRSFPSSFRLVPHNVYGIPSTLLPTMWPEFEENVSLNEDAYCVNLEDKMLKDSYTNDDRPALHW